MAALRILQKTSFIPLLLSSPRNAIQSRLISTADTVINEYRRSDAPNVTEKQWIRAHDVLGEGTASIRRTAMSGQTLPHRRSPEPDSWNQPRRRQTSERCAREIRARHAELPPGRPIRILGLARLYADSLHDVDRAETAIKAADKRGHEMGRRERAQLADAYRYRGERLMREAVKAAGRRRRARIC